MPKQLKATRPPFLALKFAEPYSSLARINAGSFLDAYVKKHGMFHDSRSMLLAFLHYLGRKKEELKNLVASDINLKDNTTKGMYEILKNKIYARKRKPPVSPKQETG